MGSIRQWSLGLVAVWVSAMWVSCGNENAARPPLSGAGGAPGSVVQWNRLSLEEKCSPPGNAPQCVDGVFRVTREGNYTLDGTPGQGKVTPAELEALSVAGDEAAGQDLGQAPICRQNQISIPEISGIEIKFAYEDGTELPLLQLGKFATNGGKCVHGSETRGDAVTSQLRGLEHRYFGQANTATRPVLNSTVGGE